MIVIESIRAAKSKPHPDYLALVRRHPLRPIRNKHQYDAAVAVLDKLAGFKLTKGQEEYLDALTVFVEAYDNIHYPMPQDVRTPLKRLGYLMEQSGMTPSRLGDLLGSRPAASMILAGDRELSKAQIRKVAAHFKIDAGYFL